MAINMSYCMFENTSRALEECLEALEEFDSFDEYQNEKGSSRYEKIGFDKLLDLAKILLERYDD